MKNLPAWIFKSRFWGASYLAWFVVLFVLSSFSIQTREIVLPTYSDKVAHFGYFACGSFVLAIWLWLKFPHLHKWTVALLVVVAAAVVGGFDEWHQTFTAGRSGLDPWDWIADVCGGVAGWVAAVVARRWVPVASQPLSC